MKKTPPAAHRVALRVAAPRCRRDEAVHVQSEPSRRRRGLLLRLLVVLLVLLVPQGCGGATAESAGQEEPPGATSAQAHRREARAQVALAREHMAGYDPNATGEQRLPISTTSPDRAGVRLYEEESYDPAMPSITVDRNPTEAHRERAAEHDALASEHYRAALQIERFEGAECTAVPPDERAACPLLREGFVMRSIEGGFRLRFEVSADREALLASMRCHHAFGRANGFGTMPSCALYLPGLRVMEGPDGTIDLTVQDAEVLRELGRRLEEHRAH